MNRETIITEAEKAMKKPRGIVEGEFNDWWLGRDRKGGAKELAKWVFDKVLVHRELFLNWKEGGTSKENITSAIPDFFETVEPSLKRLASETLEHGGQEHLYQYFWDEWAQGEWKQAQKENAAEMVWKIYQRYLDEKENE